MRRMFSVVDGPMHATLSRAADRFGGRTAVVAGSARIGFAELDGLSNALAATLVDRGVRPHDRVAVLMVNRVEFLVAVHAVSKAGAATVLVSPAWRSAEVHHALEVTEAAAGVADADGATLLGEVLVDRRVVDVDDPAVARRALVPCAEPPGVAPPALGDEAVLVFSSGTTGLPKAVRHTHRTIARATDHWCDVLALGPEDRFQVATPPSHILGILNLLAAVAAGATVRLHRRFDLDAVLECIQADRLTLEMAVAPIALAMANHPDIERYDLSSLRYIMWGATPVNETVARRVTERTGVRWLPAYGASEVPVIACNPVHRPDLWRLDSAGLPAPQTELRVVDVATSNALSTGETGEIEVRGPSVMAGYLPDEASAQAFDHGWYRTGDIGWMEPDGWVHLTDRAKEMIKVNGFQVAPAEIETVLLGHPAVRDCAVFGVPDERAGEVPAAAVALDPAVPVADGELEALVASTLATYKRLRHLVVVDSVPRLPSGKVLRRTLRDTWAPRLGASSPTGAADGQGA